MASLLTVSVLLVLAAQAGCQSLEAPIPGVSGQEAPSEPQEKASITKRVQASWLRPGPGESGVDGSEPALTPQEEEEEEVPFTERVPATWLRPLPPVSEEEEEEEEEVAFTERVPASWLRPTPFFPEEEEPFGLQGREPPPQESPALAGRIPPLEQLGPNEWVTPFRLSKMSVQPIQLDSWLPDYGRFRLRNGVTAEFTSPNFPKDYPGYIWNTWEFITETAGADLRVTCDVFELGKGDFLLARPQGEGRRTFRADARDVEVTASGQMQVEFRSNRLGGGRLRCKAHASGGEKPAVEASAVVDTDPFIDLSKPIDLNAPICGRTKAAKRIVGGSEAPPHAFPWLVALQTGRSKVQFCGGSIINERYILTAAHCVDGRTPTRLAIAVAKHKRVNDESERIFRVESIIKHEKYNRATQDNDVAIVKLRSSLRSLMALENGWVRPICLPEVRCQSRVPSTCYTKRLAVLAGWGLLKSESLVGASAVQFVRVPIMENADCQSDYAADRIGITRRMVCAAYPEGGKDSCQGDSGGPMAVVGDNDIYTQVGVVSFGKGCALPGYPGVYARVSEFGDWIRRNSKL
ncbi:serine protease 44-like [Pollicipes pollicipes]|uniref:serine protease 44-like n=1 Tax=Pollicipes pollicipes TaxID=41117 RepID=UPI001885329C|nr:serine protease 44-like [Pollicipes pollicipes]